MTILTEQYVFAALDAELGGMQFPIQLDDAWVQMGYARKSTAIRAVKTKLIENLDWRRFAHQSAKPSGGRPSDQYCLSIEGYEHFCMMAETEEGREIRKLSGCDWEDENP